MVTQDAGSQVTCPGQVCEPLQLGKPTQVTMFALQVGHVVQVGVPSQLGEPGQVTSPALQVGAPEQELWPSQVGIAPSHVGTFGQVGPS